MAKIKHSKDGVFIEHNLMTDCKNSYLKIEEYDLNNIWICIVADLNRYLKTKTIYNNKRFNFLPVLVANRIKMNA